MVLPLGSYVLWWWIINQLLHYHRCCHNACADCQAGVYVACCRTKNHILFGSELAKPAEEVCLISYSLLLYQMENVNF